MEMIHSFSAILLSVAKWFPKNIYAFDITKKHARNF